MRQTILTINQNASLLSEVPLVTFFGLAHPWVAGSISVLCVPQLDEVKSRIDLERVHFLGNVPYPIFTQLLQLSSCHVYLTYPFVLSWSCIEALATGCLVIGSDTGPVREVIEHGVNGLLVDFFNYEAIADAVIRSLSDPASFIRMRQNARASAKDNYDLRSVCLPKQLALIESILAKHR
ncbi:MAG: glycosyltransferase [Betaproteobacteria bacterium]